MKSNLLHLIFFTCLTTTVAALSAASWRAQSIYQILTDRFARTDGSTTAPCNVNEYCGGTWRGIINHLDYIQQMGFTAIWISPIVQNIVGDSVDGSSYHGYWAQNIYQVNPNFGTSADLKALSTALHARGMYLMVDIVTNHMGYLGCGKCVDYSIYTPFNSQSYYHPFCIIDYSNTTSIQVCWEGDNIVSLPDLRTENTNVQTIWNTWITELVANYSIDGLRVDSAQQTGVNFFPSFQDAAGVYVIGEIYNGDPTYVCPFQNYMNGVLNYPTYYWITQAFQSTNGSISNLVNGINTMKSTCSDTTLLGSFLENHDVARFPSYTSDLTLAKNAIAFTILADGIPIIYQGQEHHLASSSVPSNREALWLLSSPYSPTTPPLSIHIASLNQIRNQAIYIDPTYVTYKAYPIYSNAHTIVMRKGYAGKQIIGIFSNKGSAAGNYTVALTGAQTGFAGGVQVVEVLACETMVTDGGGGLGVVVRGGLPRVYYGRAGLVGSGVCGL
ncbi:glycoside hydrolase family 13 protein [Sclerotinia borealis F-4128]|uniref:alpha-amylase n=1 Tax=Sclerotinia borealis (strain F-4128) TaxID=1432307 RepID=W9C363_SCLBF|nr:glycoside hydrolase family 13 protein [Sclerotinia borealis F-4128]